MANFFDHIDFATARVLERLSRLSLELRNARTGVLRHYGIGHEDELLARVVAGEVAEHPAYEHVLAMRILDDAREVVRGLIARNGRDDEAQASLHAALKAYADESLSGLLAEPCALTLDALTLRLKNDVSLEVHYAAPDQYALWWQSAAGRAGIDTAPLHAGLASGPGHMHLADGRVVADTVTRPGASPEDNLRALVEALHTNSRLGIEG